MRVRPYHAWAFLAAVLAVSAWRAWGRCQREFLDSGPKVTSWPSLARMTTEELDRGMAHRYQGLAQALNGQRDVGYFSERGKSTLWSDPTPEGFNRINRYYMAQGILPPALLRLDEVWPLVVVDCGTPEQAREVLSQRRLAVIRDFGRGLVLARPEE